MAFFWYIIDFLFKILNKRGILNLGGKPKSIYDFAKKENKYVKKIFLGKRQKLGMPFNSTMNLSKLNLIIKKKNWIRKYFLLLKDD